MPAEVLTPLRAPGVERCAHGAGLGPLANVLAWPPSPPPSLALQVWAREQLRHPLGTVIRDVVEGVPVVARIECHFSYGAHPELPGRWHRGTSVYRPAERGPSGELVALTSPPPGWPSSST